MFQITDSWLVKNKTPRGGWTDLQMRAIGFTEGYQAKKWKKRAIGQWITEEQKELFESFANSGFTKKTEKKIRDKIKSGEATLEQVSKAYSHRVESIVWQVSSNNEYVNSSEFLKSSEWAKVRMKVLRKNGAACQCCGATAKDGAKICVDHIKPRQFFPQLALDENNLQVLCDLCNLGKGNVHIEDWR